MKELSNKLALVTGSSRGLGAAMAMAFAEHGARVVLHGRDRAALAAVRDAISHRGGSALVVTGDVTSESDIDAMRATIERQYGVVDILVANAGGSFTPPAPLEQIPLEGWRASVDGNLTATFLTLKSFLPSMKQRKTGNIITLSSSAGRHADPRSPIPYGAAKAAVQMLTQHLATQLGPYGIRVNCIAPATILTERNDARIPAEQRPRLIEMHPLRRLGRPDDVADAAVFLASERSSWITGQIIDVAGGYSMM
jgi:3-oxoacyl-[acyl-carrier protein] reductase